MSWLFGLVNIVNLNAVTNPAHLDCPNRPSCVSSLATEHRRRIEALNYSGPPARALDRLAKIVEALPGGAVTNRTDRNLRAAFTSRVFGFVDDVEVVIRDSTHMDVRSMSRSGYYDFGVNRARIERIRREFSSFNATVGQCPRNVMTEMRTLAVFLVICFSVSTLGGLITSTSVGTWYQLLDKPGFNPPDWVFFPVWSLLFLTIAISGWLAWRVAGPSRGLSFILYGLQLVINFAWSCLFFGLQSPLGGLVCIVALLFAIGANVREFLGVSRLAGLLLIPYASWACFAAVLNACIWWLNRG